LRSNTKDYGGKTHKTDSQISDITAPSGRAVTIFSSRSRLPVWKLLDTPSYVPNESYYCCCCLWKDSCCVGQTLGTPDVQSQIHQKWGTLLVMLLPQRHVAFIAFLEWRGNAITFHRIIDFASAWMSLLYGFLPCLFTRELLDVILLY
jgi:hypothetical protein